MNKSVLRRILSFAKPNIHYLVLALLSAIISVGMTLFAPVIIGKCVDLIVAKGNVDFVALKPLLFKLAITIIISAGFQWLMTLCTNVVTHKTIKALRMKAFEKLQQLPLNYIDKKPHGDIISRLVSDIELISDGLLQGFTQLFSGIIMILGTLAFMLSINVSISIIVVVITPVSLFVASFIAKRSFNMFKEQSQTRGEMSGFIEEMIGNQNIVKAFNNEINVQDSFEEINERLHICGIKAQFFSSLTNPTTRFLNGIVFASVGVLGAIKAINGQISIGQLSCFLTYANQYTKPFNEISGVITELQGAFASARRVFQIIDEPTEKQDNINAFEMTSCDGTIEIDNICFSYSPKKSLIENFNLSVRSGEKIAIVGPTGCGKTTIINLLMRFYEVTSGDIIVNGKNVKDITKNSLRSMFGMVLQDTWMLSGTISDNIAYGKQNATKDEIIDAAKAAFAHSFIKRLPDGYDTIISEDTTNISQGQKQLISIARIMLTKPPMLILDEATSSIDTLTEMKIQKAFTKIMEGRTSFIVAHRLSTIKEADTILVMNSGKIIEQGKHDELLSKNGFYANLYNSQFVHNNK